MTHSINSIDLAVAKFLEENKISYEFHYAGEGKDKDWEYDIFMVSFKDSKGTKKNFEFKTGIGHRINVDVKKSNFGIMPIKEQQFIKELKELLKVKTGSPVHFKLSDIKTIRSPYGKPYHAVAYAVAPTQASVLYCLISSIEALDQSLEDWAGYFGYDIDSREAERIYFACKDEAIKLKAVFTNKQIEELQELLQDY